MGELMAGNHTGVINVWSGHTAPHVLPEELHGGHGYLVALIAGGVRNPRRGSRGLVVGAWARGGHRRVTPCSAQQRGIWPNCQCQHNRNYNCSKGEHVMLNPLGGKKGANEPAASGFQNRRRFPLSAPCWAKLARFSLSSAENPATVFTASPRVDCLLRPYLERRNDAVLNCTPQLRCFQVVVLGNRRCTPIFRTCTGAASRL